MFLHIYDTRMLWLPSRCCWLQLLLCNWDFENMHININITNCLCWYVSCHLWGSYMHVHLISAVFLCLLVFCLFSVADGWLSEEDSLNNLHNEIVRACSQLLNFETIKMVFFFLICDSLGFFYGDFVTGCKERTKSTSSPLETRGRTKWTGKLVRIARELTWALTV